MQEKNDKLQALANNVTDSQNLRDELNRLKKSAPIKSATELTRQRVSELQKVFADLQADAIKSGLLIIYVDQYSSLFNCNTLYN